jgi:hypothetical protein
MGKISFQALALCVVRLFGGAPGYIKRATTVPKTAHKTDVQIARGICISKRRRLTRHALVRFAVLFAVQNPLAWGVLKTLIVSRGPLFLLDRSAPEAAAAGWRRGIPPKRIKFGKKCLRESAYRPACRNNDCAAFACEALGINQQENAVRLTSCCWYDCCSFTGVR